MYPSSNYDSQLRAIPAACNAAPSACILGLFQSKSQTTYYSTYDYFSKNIKLSIDCKLSIGYVQRRAGIG